VTMFCILYSIRFAAACVRDFRNAAMSEIWSGVMDENAGIPLDGRPFNTTGPMVLPLLSCSTMTERTKSGPLSPPVAFVPWQNPHVGTKIFCPRATAAGSGGAPMARKSAARRCGVWAGGAFLGAGAGEGACALIKREAAPNNRKLQTTGGAKNFIESSSGA